MRGALRTHVDATTGTPPAVTAEAAPFWDAAKEGRSVAERGSDCGAESFPPRGISRARPGRATSRLEVTGLTSEAAARQVARADVVAVTTSAAARRGRRG